MIPKKYPTCMIQHIIVCSINICITRVIIAEEVLSLPGTRYISLLVNTTLHGGKKDEVVALIINVQGTVYTFTGICMHSYSLYQVI